MIQPSPCRSHIAAYHVAGRCHLGLKILLLNQLLSADVADNLEPQVKYLSDSHRVQEA